MKFKHYISQFHWQNLLNEALGGGRDYTTHARFIKARLKYYDDLVKQGKSESEAFKIVKKASMKDLKKLGY